MKLSQFISQSHIDASLIRSVVRNMGGWGDFKEYAQDICNYGANSGFGNFIYYSDTVQFTKRNKTTIFNLCDQMADECGYINKLELLANFNCLKNEYNEYIADGLYNPRSEHKTMVFNALAWFALEEVARSYTDLLDN